MSQRRPTLDYGQPDPKPPLRDHWYHPELVISAMILIAMLMIWVGHYLSVIP